MRYRGRIAEIFERDPLTTDTPTMPHHPLSYDPETDSFPNTHLAPETTPIVKHTQRPNRQPSPGSKPKPKRHRPPAVVRYNNIPERTPIKNNPNSPPSPIPSRTHLAFWCNPSKTFETHQELIRLEYNSICPHIFINKRLPRSRKTYEAAILAMPGLLFIHRDDADHSFIRANKSGLPSRIRKLFSRGEEIAVSPDELYRTQMQLTQLDISHARARVKIARMKDYSHKTEKKPKHFGHKYHRYIPGMGVIINSGPFAGKAAQIVSFDDPYVLVEMVESPLRVKINALLLDENTAF